MSNFDNKNCFNEKRSVTFNFPKVEKVSNEENLNIKEEKVCTKFYENNEKRSIESNTFLSTPAINSISLANQMEQLYKRYYLLNKHAIQRKFTRNLLSVGKAIHELDELQKIEENKKNTYVVGNKSKKEDKASLCRTKGDNNLKNFTLSLKPFERLHPSSFKKVIIQNNNVVDCVKKGEDVLDNFIKTHCKSYVYKELKMGINEDSNGTSTKVVSNLSNNVILSNKNSDDCKKYIESNFEDLLQPVEKNSKIIQEDIKKIEENYVEQCSVLNTTNERIVETSMERRRRMSRERKRRYRAKLTNEQIEKIKYRNRIQKALKRNKNQVKETKKIY